MAINFTSDHDQRLTTVTATGQVSFDQWLQFFDAYALSGPTLLEIYDLRELNSLLDSTQIQQVVTRGQQADPKPRPAGGKTALVVSKKVHYGLSRIYASFAETADLPWEVNIFSSMEDARQWLVAGARPPVNR